MLVQHWESQGGTDVAVDRVLSFFEAVHHLKEWLGNDPTVQVTKANGDELIDSHLVLQLCADLANGSKHLKLDSTRTGAPQGGQGNGAPRAMPSPHWLCARDVELADAELLGGG
jgi:hypothetical protein